VSFEYFLYDDKWKIIDSIRRFYCITSFEVVIENILNLKKKMVKPLLYDHIAKILSNYYTHFLREEKNNNDNDSTTIVNTWKYNMFLSFKHKIILFFCVWQLEKRKRCYLLMFWIGVWQWQPSSQWFASTESNSRGNAAPQHQIILHGAGKMLWY